MPVVSVTLEDTNRTILSNIYYKIVRDIVDRINIPYSTLVVLHKDIEATLTDNKTNVSIKDNVNIPSTVSKRKVQVSITEEYNEDALTSTPIHQISAHPIFLDRDIDVSVYPIYIKSDINIEFNYITPSKIEANRIRDDIRIRLSQTRNIDIHEVEYDILIPEVVEDFISDVYDLKNRLVPDTLEDYFREHSTPRIYPITDMSNINNTKLAIKEKQVRILGLFDFNSMPEKLEVDNENNNYKFSFIYKLSLEIPRAIALRYPVMICNKLLPNKYIQFLEDSKLYSKEELNKVEGYLSGSTYFLSNFEAHRQLEYKTDIHLPVNVPIFDEFTLRYGHKGYGILASFLVEVNEVDKKSLFNLKDIYPYELPDFLIKFISDGELNYITNPYSSFIYIGLHQDCRFFDANILEIDSDLNIKSSKELSLFKPVRVTLSYCIDISMLNEKVIERLKLRPDMLIFFLKEYVTTMNNFRTEAKFGHRDNNIFRTFIELIVYYYDTDQPEIISYLVDVIKLDSYNENYFSTMLYTGYNELYNRLLKYQILYIDPKTFTITNTFNTDITINSKYDSYTNSNDSEINFNRFKIELPIMKTVMTNNVLAYRNT